MRPKAVLAGAFLFLFLAGGIAAAAMIPTTLSADGGVRLSAPGEQTLVLRGRGLFRYMGVKLYTATLYTAAAIHTSEAALADTPKRLSIRYLRRIPKDAIVQAAEKNLKNYPEVNYAALQSRI